ncbi:MAG TPA: HlyD family efflux transporter periplasmic adaptor subunit [Polyangiaceae bacterium]|nr:HlyD family efflux transporter periplasmic adaptor subunit [Polyangiaceae bacterium]
MADAFSRTFRAMDSDSGARGRLMALVAMGLFAAWGAWFSLARLSVYETSEIARLEVVRATHPVDSPVAGRVVSAHLILDDEVHEGDVLVELDAQPQRLALAESQSKLASVAPKLEATRAQLDAEKQALANFHHQGKATLDEATNRVEEARISAELAGNEFERIDKLQKSGAVPEVDAVRAKADVMGKSAAEAALRSQQSKVEREWLTGQSDRATRIAALQLDMVRLETDLGQLRTEIESLEHEIERRHLRAPASGHIGEISNVRPGAFVDEGDRIGTIVARGDLRVVAEFKPAAAFGRIRPGQPARVRFDGFPWTEFGDVQASVADVAREVRDGRARVELGVVSANERIPMQHGLPGSVEVEVERTSPARLALRAAGQLLHRSDEIAPPPPAPSAGPPHDRRQNVTRR